MSAIINGVALWLVDFHLLAMALLVGVLAALAAVKQPARRMAVMKATLGSLAGLAILCALPGWSAVHLLTDRPATSSEAIADRIDQVPAAQSVTQLIPHINVHRDPPPRLEHQAILQPEIASSSSQRTEAANWVRVGTFAHAAGSAMVVVWLVAGAVMAWRIRRGAIAASAELQLALEQIAGPSRAPRLLASVEVATPVAMGIIDSTIILPTAMTGAGSADPLAPILAHELAHVRNGDLHSVALSRVLLVLLWPQPLYWWLRRSLRLDQEALADAAAAEVAGRVAYAERLVGWARHQGRGHKAPRLAGAVGLWEGPSQLKRRVALLVNEKFLVMRSCSRRWRGACFAALTLAAIALSLVTVQPATQAANDKSKPPAEATEVERGAASKGASRAPATISGKIVLQDGSPAQVKGWLYSEASDESSTSISSEGRFTDDFNVKIKPGTVWLKYWADGFAPTWVGPLEIKSGQLIDDVRLVLQEGRPASVQVRSDAGEPIAGATVQPMLRINSSGSGPSVKFVTDELGDLTLEHLAEAKYELRVTAPGFEPLRQDVTITSTPKVTRWEAPITLTMKPSQPTTGVVLNADGSPAKGALIRFRGDASKGRTMSGSQPFGEVAATADDEGRFTLDQLAPGHDYLFLVEAADKARDMMPPIVAGMKDVEVKMAPRRDLEVRIKGDLSKLPERNGKRYIGVRQRVEFKGVHGHQYGDLIGEDAYVTPTEEGGEFTYEGLANAPVEVTAGDTTQTFKVAKSGVTPVVVELGVKPRTATDEAAKETPAVKPASQRSAIGPDEIGGTVVDEAAQPIAGATVDVWTWFPGNETKTDAGGRFRVKTGDKREQAQFRVTKDGYSPFYVNRHPQGMGDLTIVLGDKTYLEGTLRGVDGQVVKDATIRAEHPALNEQGDKIGEVPTETKTDEHGRYKMFVFPETYELQAAVAGVGAMRLPAVTVRQDEAKQLDLQLEPAVQFEAKVVDAATGKPVPGLILWSWKDRSVFGKSDDEGRIVIDGMMPGKFEFSVGSGEPQKIRGVTYYAHGEVGRWWSADADTEWERRRIEPDGWQRNFDDLSFDLSVGMQPITIEVEPGVTFSGRVVDPDGKPVSGATVAPAKTGSGNSLTGDTRYSERTKDDGTFRIVMPAGNKFPYNLIAHDGDYEEWRQWANGVSEIFTTEPGEVINDIELRLTRPATVRGRLTSNDGQPVAGKQVRAHAADLKENRYYDPTTEVRTGNDGVFELKFIRPGKHYIQAQPFWLEAATAPEGTSATIEVKEGEVYEGVELELAPAFAPATRTIFDAPTIVPEKEKSSAVPEDATDSQAGVIRDRTADRAEASVTAAATEQPLLVATVVDDETGERLKDVSVLAGVSPLEHIGWQWQPHTIYKFADGRIQWPPPKRRPYDDQMVRIEAKGYVPMQVRVRKGEAQRDLEIRMERDAGVEGRVIDSQGEPVPDAQIALWMAARHAPRRVHDKFVQRPLPANAPARDHWSRAIVVTADAEGKFSVPTEIVEQSWIAAVHPQGYVKVRFPSFVQSKELELAPWGTVEAQVLWGDVPGANEQVGLQGQLATTDAQGRARFEFVSPGPAWVGRHRGPYGESQMTMSVPSQQFTVEPGKVVQVVLGGAGRPVVGKLIGRDSWETVRIRIAPNAPHIGFPGDNEAWQAYGEFLGSPAGKTYKRDGVPAAADGTFRIEGVPPEDYQLFVTSIQADARSENIGYGRFSIETLPDGMSDEPLNIGEIKIQPATPSSAADAKEDSAEQ